MLRTSKLEATMSLHQNWKRLLFQQRWNTITFDVNRTYWRVKRIDQTNQLACQINVAQRLAAGILLELDFLKHKYDNGALSSDFYIYASVMPYLLGHFGSLKHGAWQVVYWYSHLLCCFRRRDSSGRRRSRARGVVWGARERERCRCSARVATFALALHCRWRRS